MIDYRNHVFTITDPISEVVPERTQRQVVLATLSEIGELAEEVNVASGYAAKMPDEDGVAGEAADVMICLADLVWKSFPDERTRIEVQQGVRSYDVLNFMMPGDWEEVEEGLTMVAEVVTDLSRKFRTVGVEGMKAYAQETAEAIDMCVHDLLKAAKTDDPILSSSDFRERLERKTEKWYRKCAAPDMSA